MGRKPDRRTQRTRQRLHAALMSLIGQKRYGRVTIDEIAAHADVGRSTFYTHFGSKDDLLFSVFGPGLKALATRPIPASERGGLRRFQFSLPLLRHIDEQRRFAIAMLTEDESASVRRRLDGILVEVVALELDRWPARLSPRDAHAHGVVGAFLGLVTWWLTSGSKASAESVDAVFQHIAVPS